jgi:hypothetical protein
MVMRWYVAALLVGALTVTAYAAATPTPWAHAQPSGPGCATGGMMGPGMMGPGMMGPGMMGPGMWSGGQVTASISIDQAIQAVDGCLQSLGNSDLAAEEVMEFQNNFYAIVQERTTGLGAFELVVNKSTGAVFPEPGPNMMWNTKYGMQGHMGGYPQVGGPMTITADQAAQIAQQWLDQGQPGSTVEPPDAFYGYYTVHTVWDGTVSGMLSVSGYTGQVWYHTWHGPFIAMRELE